MKIIRSMAKPRSQYVKNKLNGFEWSENNEEYIKNLLTIEDHVLDGINCHSSALCDYFLKSSYPREYADILRELNLRQYQSFLDEKREREEEDFRIKTEEETKRNRDRQQWRIYGGN